MILYFYVKKIPMCLHSLYCYSNSLSRWRSLILVSNISRMCHRFTFIKILFIGHQWCSIHSGYRVLNRRDKHLCILGVLCYRIIKEKTENTCVLELVLLFNCCVTTDRKPALPLQTLKSKTWTLCLCFIYFFLCHSFILSHWLLALCTWY